MTIRPTFVKWLYIALTLSCAPMFYLTSAYFPQEVVIPFSMTAERDLIIDWRLYRSIMVWILLTVFLILVFLEWVLGRLPENIFRKGSSGGPGRNMQNSARIAVSWSGILINLLFVQFHYHTYLFNRNMLEYCNWKGGWFAIFLVMLISVGYGIWYVRRK